MNIYIFESVDRLTWNYHSGGAAAVVAKDEASAKGLVAEHYKNYSATRWECGDETPTGPSEEEWAEAVVYPLAGEHEPRFFQFPDAGCC